MRVSCLTLLLACIAGAAERPAVRFLAPCPGVVVVSERAPVELGGKVIAKVERGRRFGVMEREGDLFRIQAFTGKNLRYGWLHARHVKPLANADVDLVAEAIAVARELNPTLDAATCKARVDAMAHKATRAATALSTPAGKLRAIARVLFRDERFGFHLSSHAIDQVLARRKGNCLSLSVLYLSLARGLKLPLAAVSVPRHALVRYDDGHHPINIEPSMGGVFVPDAYVGQRCARSGSGPKLLSHLELVGVMKAQAATDLYTRGDHARANALFARAVELAPTHSETYHNWGTALLALCKPALACDKFARAVRIDPRAAPSLYSWGVALSMMREPAWACDKFARAIEIDPRSAKAHYNWGVVLLQMGKRSEALAKLRQAVALSPALKPQVEKLLQTINDRTQPQP